MTTHCEKRESSRSGMLPVATFHSFEDVEDAGQRLFDEGIEPSLSELTIYVDERDLERAQAILKPEPDTVEPFHPCPRCGVPDPVWYGKRKAILLIAIIGVVVLLIYERVPARTFVLAAALSALVFGVAIKRIPDFECRQCRTRYY